MLPVLKNLRWYSNKMTLSNIYFEKGKSMEGMLSRFFADIYKSINCLLAHHSAQK